MKVRPSPQAPRPAAEILKLALTTAVDKGDDLASAIGGALVLLEWAERFPALMPQERTEIRLLALGEDEREITVSRST